MCLVRANVALDGPERRVSVDGRTVALSPREVGLLAVLMQNVDHVVNSDHLLDLLWGPHFTGDPGILAVYIYRLRSKLRSGGATALIRTVRGIGYRFESEPAPISRSA